MRKKKKLIAIRVEEEILSKFKEKLKMQGHQLSYVIRLLIENYLKRGKR